MTATWLEREKAELRAWLDKLGADNEDLAQLGEEALTLAVDVAAAKLRGDDTEIAEAALRAVRSNLFATGGARFAYAVIGHVEEVLTRVVAIGMRALLGGVV